MTFSQIEAHLINFSVTSLIEQELCSQKEGFLVSFRLPGRGMTALQESLWMAIFPFPCPVADNLMERTFTS